MKKRNLTTVVTIILSTSTLYAHPNWGVETGMNWQWARKSATPVSVKLKIEPWAEIYCSNGANLTLQQETGSTNYSGCVQLNLLNNFQNLRVVADVATQKPGGTWSISLVEAGDQPSFSVNQTSLYVYDTHLNVTSPGLLDLCILAEDWNPYVLDYSDGDVVASVTMTMYIDNTLEHPKGNACSLGVIAELQEDNE